MKITFNAEACMQCVTLRPQLLAGSNQVLIPMLAISGLMDGKTRAFTAIITLTFPNVQRN